MENKAWSAEQMRDVKVDGWHRDASRCFKVDVQVASSVEEGELAGVLLKKVGQTGYLGIQQVGESN